MKLKIVLLFCLFLVGCQKCAKSHSQHFPARTQVVYCLGVSIPYVECFAKGIVVEHSFPAEDIVVCDKWETK